MDREKRNGILAAGVWLIDHTKHIDHYPEPSRLATISEITRSNGGGAFNLLVDLAKLEADFPLTGAGLIGTDANGDWIESICRSHRINTESIHRTRELPTSCTDVMTERATGRRTFFYLPGANQRFAAEHIPFSRSTARIFYLGYPGLLPAIDARDSSGVSDVLQRAAEAGFVTAMDLVSADGCPWKSIAQALPWVDILFTNEWEAARLLDLPSAAENALTRGDLISFGRALLGRGVRRAVVVHSAHGAICTDAGGSSSACGAVAVPADQIQGTCGAGDALAAGFLLKAHDGKPWEDCLELGVCAAAMCLRDLTSSNGLKSAPECVAEGRRAVFAIFRDRTEGQALRKFGVQPKDISTFPTASRTILMEKSLDQKLVLLRENSSADTFILADAKDADMAWGISSPGKRWPLSQGARPLYSMDEYIEQIREIVAQGLVDIMLTSVSTMSLLAHREHLFDRSSVTPAIRANDTSDIWLSRGARYSAAPSRPFATCDLREAQYGALGAATSPAPRVNLGLYSITFNNDIERDRESLLAFKQFRRECAENGFRYFLELFAPNVACGLTETEMPGYLNDQIVRSLAGVAREHRPEFLKIPYFGPRWLEELCSYDSSLIVGILGGASGTTHDAFTLLANAKKHGARVALFGRRIKDSEHPLTFVRYLRQIADTAITPSDAVRAYHADLAKLGIPPKRALSADLELSDAKK